MSTPLPSLTPSVISENKEFPLRITTVVTFAKIALFMFMFV